MKRIATLLVCTLLLAACGQNAPLQPIAPNRLPPPPYGASEPLGPEELLELDPQAAPERSIELRSESEEREDDPFDLPPEG